MSAGKGTRPWVARWIHLSGTLDGNHPSEMTRFGRGCLGMKTSKLTCAEQFGCRRSQLMTGLPIAVGLVEAKIFPLDLDLRDRMLC